jgi:hypothetical protein
LGVVSPTVAFVWLAFWMVVATIAFVSVGSPKVDDTETVCP